MPTLDNALIAIVAGAAALQASIGFGLAIVAAPLLALLDRGYIPGPLIASGTCLALIMVLRERRAVDLTGVRIAVAGRVLGAIPAGYALSLASQETFDLLFSALVLAAVGISLFQREIRPTPRVIFAAGIASGFMGTITSIGGPPMALVYQSSRGPELRATLPGADFELGVIAGTGGINPLGNAVIGTANDGTVSVASTQIGGMRDFLEMDVSHTFIMRNAEVARQTIAFLREGHFARELR